MSKLAELCKENGWTLHDFNYNYRHRDMECYKTGLVIEDSSGTRLCFCCKSRNWNIHEVVDHLKAQFKIEREKR